MMTNGKKVVNVFCIASPLHYLASTAIAREHAQDSRKILLCYRQHIMPMIQQSLWDDVIYAPWPRFDPLPGIFGKHRRLIDNINNLSAQVGQVDEIILHSPVFDTEAVNYYLHALPRLCGNPTLRARIIPDGTLNLSIHPLNAPKIIGQYFRKLRRLSSPKLNYTCFRGDRIGSDADFVDRIYTLPGLPSPYKREKIFPINKLIDPDTRNFKITERTALIIGQPLVSLGLIKESDSEIISERMHDWIKENRIERIFYKKHPRERSQEFNVHGSELINISEPLELHLVKSKYFAILGIHSTAMLLSKQILGDDIMVASFGTHLLKNSKKSSIQFLITTMKKLGIELIA